jgi:hypothetical protein
LCKKEEGCYPLGKILANTIPMKKEDAPHVRIFMEGNSQECKSGLERSQCI